MALNIIALLFFITKKYGTEQASDTKMLYNPFALIFHMPNRKGHDTEYVSNKN